MLIVLFGLSAAGKNFVGEIFAKHFNYYYWDADTVLPDDMKHAILHRQLFTQPMRDRFAHIINERITTLSQQHSNIVISQALYKEKNRQQILKAHPDAIMIHVIASLETIIYRLKQRNDWVNEEYAAKISHQFEPPAKTYRIINNDSSQDTVITQIRQLLAEKKNQKNT